MNQFQTRGNEEQQKAIFHHGGVLLSAGAGSGKTFVLVEHVTYLIWQFYQDNQSQNRDELVRNLKNYLSSIVLMTFTKKAAGELAIRLKMKVRSMQDCASDEQERWLWEVAPGCLDSMTIGTIDGFCYKLITQGFFPGLPMEMAIVSDIESSKKITELYDEWLSVNFSSDLSKLEGVESFFVINHDEFVNAFIKIFTTPELRLLWSDSTPESMLNYNWDDFCEVIFDNCHPRQLEFMAPDLPTGSKGAWVEKFQTLSSFFATKRAWSLQDFLELHRLFQENKTITTGPRTDGDVKDYFARVKAIKDALKPVADELVVYEESGRELLQRQVELMLSAFNWIETRYSQITGFTFADLEYYVMRGLRDESARENVSNRYRYLIVDEFQDTSRIQFDIIRSIIKDDFKRLFCVGDEKQAIYGFRGGELAVFKDCKKFIPQNLDLANNYRSLGNVIEFNNAVFADLFMRGEKYEGLDPHPVEVVAQKCPLEERVGLGSLTKYAVTVNIAEDEKLPEGDGVEVEANAILSCIKESIKRDPNEGICVLYKGLKPSLGLMTSLISEGISLKAQVKVSYPQDPMIAIFSCLVDGVRLAEQKKVSITQTPCLFMLEQLFAYLELAPAQLSNSLEVFIENLDALGLQPTFADFLHRVGIANSNHVGNMAEIERVIKLAAGDLETITELLNGLRERKYSIEFQSPGKGNVTIMTAHASKGLQFSHVILGGIHNNGRKIPTRDIVGKLPGSLRYRAHSEQKTKFKTPQMLMENAIDNLKDFAESKRLFYVACTRAENKLSWIDLRDSNGKEFCAHSNSWIKGLRTFETETANISKYADLFEIMNQAQVISEQTLDRKNASPVSVASLPMFQIDPLGISSVDGSSEEGFVVFPEMSVTKLATISQCTRKFYLKNICKLEENVEFDVKEIIEAKSFDTDEVVYNPMVSAAERGTLIHEAISYGILHRGVISLAHQKELDEKSLKAVKWAITRALNYAEESELHSELPLKFDFYGQMVSGTPDLFILAKDSSHLHIIDFKTGRPGDVKEKPYWFQLTCYAKAVSSLYPSFENAKATIELWYVDSEQVKTKELDQAMIENELGSQWSKLTRPFSPSTEHCSHCGFGKICHPNTR